MVISVLFPETLHISNIVLYGGIVFLCTGEVPSKREINKTAELY